VAKLGVSPTTTHVLQDAPEMHPLTSAWLQLVQKNLTFFCASDDYVYANYDEYYIDLDYLAHGYYIIGYLTLTPRLHPTATRQKQLQSTFYIDMIFETWV
jgi:hypothetical protein